MINLKSFLKLKNNKVVKDKRFYGVKDLNFYVKKRIYLSKLLETLIVISIWVLELVQYPLIYLLCFFNFLDKDVLKIEKFHICRIFYKLKNIWTGDIIFHLRCKNCKKYTFIHWNIYRQKHLNIYNPKTYFIEYCDNCFTKKKF